MRTCENCNAECAVGTLFLVHGKWVCSGCYKTFVGMANSIGSRDNEKMEIWDSIANWNPFEHKLKRKNNSDLVSSIVKPSGDNVIVVDEIEVKDRICNDDDSMVVNTEVLRR